MEQNRRDVMEPGTHGRSLGLLNSISAGGAQHLPDLQYRQSWFVESYVIFGTIVPGFQKDAAGLSSVVIRGTCQ